LNNRTTSPSPSLQSNLNPSQQRTPSYYEVRLCPSPRIHSGLKEQLVQLLEQPSYWTTNIWLNFLPHHEMWGKVDFTQILDLIFNPTPINDAMGEVLILSFFHQCWPSRGSSMPNPNGQTNKGYLSPKSGKLYGKQKSIIINKFHNRTTSPPKGYKNDIEVWFTPNRQVRPTRSTNNTITRQYLQWFVGIILALSTITSLGLQKLSK
jgi:hypothetical protein